MLIVISTTTRPQAFVTFLVEYSNKIHKAAKIKIHENTKLKKTVFSSKPTTSRQCYMLLDFFSMARNRHKSSKHL